MPRIAPSHPPTYYIPPSDVNTDLLTKDSKHSFCEWKGVATYFDIKSSSSNGETIKSRIWTYQEPSKRFKDIKDYFSFYAGPWDCYVDDEKVKAQPGDFYGGAYQLYDVKSLFVLICGSRQAG